jgi:galactosylceramidase
VLALEMAPDSICTASTLSTGVKGVHPPPPASTSFPPTHTDNFTQYREDSLAWGFTDIYGSFAVRAGAMRQVATAKPTGWAPTNYDPLTFIGDSAWCSLSLPLSLSRARSLSCSTLGNQLRPADLY